MYATLKVSTMEITAENLESSFHNLQSLLPKGTNYTGRKPNSLDLFYTDGSSKDSIYVIEIKYAGNHYIWPDGIVRSYFHTREKYGSILETWALETWKQFSKSENS